MYTIYQIFILHSNTLIHYQVTVRSRMSSLFSHHHLYISPVILSIHVHQTFLSFTFTSSFILLPYHTSSPSPVILSFTFTSHFILHLHQSFYPSASPVILSFTLTSHFILHLHQSFYPSASSVILSFTFTCHFILHLHLSFYPSP